MNPYVFQTAQRIVAGAHTFERIVDHLQPFAGQSAFVLAQPSMQRQGFLEQLQSALEQLDISFRVSLNIKPEPTVDNIEFVFREMSEGACDFVVGLGGGSVLDAAKLMSVLHTNPLGIRDMLGINKVTAPGLPTVLIPSTSGTGSEVTPNAIVTFPEEEVKIGVVSPYLLPKLVVLDPVLTVGLPPAITAATGMDAFTHALESFISKKANPFSDMLALESIRLISGSIERAYRNGDELEAREAMLLGSMYGGMALTCAGTAAVHAMAYPIGGKFHVAHGVANSMLLPHVMEFNLDAIEAKLTQVASTMGLAPTAEAALRQIREWTRALEIPQDLSTFGVREEHLADLAVAASRVTRLMDNNPKSMTLPDIERIYRKLL